MWWSESEGILSVCVERGVCTLGALNAAAKLLGRVQVKGSADCATES